MVESLDVQFYNNVGISYEHAFSHNPALLAFVQTIVTHLPPHGHILDVGCGTGKPVASTLSAAGHAVTGIDISSEMVDLARKAVPDGKFEVIDMREYAPPREEKLDAVLNILSLFVLSREEIEMMAERWASWLEIGSLLCICSLAVEDCKPKMVAKGKGYDEDGLCARDVGGKFMGSEVQMTLFTREGWRKLLRERGFEILQERTDLFVPPKEADTDEEAHYYLIAKKVE